MPQRENIPTEKIVAKKSGPDKAKSTRDKKRLTEKVKSIKDQKQLAEMAKRIFEETREAFHETFHSLDPNERECAQINFEHGQLKMALEEEKLTRKDRKTIHDLCMEMAKTELIDSDEEFQAEEESVREDAVLQGGFPADFAKHCAKCDQCWECINDNPLCDNTGLCPEGAGLRGATPKQKS